MSSSIQSWVVVMLPPCRRTVPRPTRVPFRFQSVQVRARLGLRGGLGLGLGGGLGLRFGAPRASGSGSGSAASASGSGSAAASGSGSAAAPRGRGLTRHETLVGDRLQLDREPANQRVEPAHEPGQRRRDRRDELGVEHIAGGQARDRANVVGRQGRTVHQAALELEQVQGARRVIERLGGDGRIAADERQRGRADEHRLELLRRRPCRRRVR